MGKFIPFHKGHEYLISTALAEMDHVVVIVYNASETTNVPTVERGRWIQQIFPEVEVLIAEDGPQVTGYTDEVIETQNRYLQRLLEGRQIHSFYSSEPYGEHVSKALGCRNRTVDLDRIHYPISGTMLRSESFLRAQYLSPCVLAALKPRIYLLGAPSTGKTTLAQYAANKLCVPLCLEYGREYWFQFQQNHRLTMRDLENIAGGQMESEEKTAMEEVPLIIADTSVVTTYSYALYYFGEVSECLEDMMRSSAWRHQSVFLCDADIPFEDTWDRSGPNSREKLQEINVEVLQKFGIRYQLLSGSVADRFQIVQGSIRQWMY